MTSALAGHNSQHAQSNLGCHKKALASILMTWLMISLFAAASGATVVADLVAIF